MIERRKIPRRLILFYSRVFDRRTGIFVGYLGEMNENGMMIISETPLKTNQVFPLRIDLPEDSYARPVLEFDAYSVWCERDTDPHFYNTGFRFLNIPEETRQIILQVIDDCGFRDQEHQTGRGKGAQGSSPPSVPDDHTKIQQHGDFIEQPAPLTRGDGVGEFPEDAQNQ